MCATSTLPLANAQRLQSLDSSPKLQSLDKVGIGIHRAQHDAKMDAMYREVGTYPTYGAKRKPQMTSLAILLLDATGYTGTALSSRLHHLCICLEVKFVWIFETFESAASCARVCHSGWNCILSHLCKQSQ